MNNILDVCKFNDLLIYTNNLYKIHNDKKLKVNLNIVRFIISVKYLLNNNYRKANILLNLLEINKNHNLNLNDLKYLINIKYKC